MAALADTGNRVRFTLIQAGLDHIAQGFSVFDRDLRLVVWNRSFLDLLEFPVELAQVGTPFADFMRYNAKRGEYGSGDVEDLVAERVALARLFQPHEMERARPSGQVILVRGGPLPEGGFVTIYTDVTEQRRYERILQDQASLLEVRIRERTSELEAANLELKRAYDEQKRTEAALLQAQKMEAVGQLAGGLAHDFNNLLTIIIGNLVPLERHPRSEVTENIVPAVSAARRGVALIQRLLAFARQQPLAPIPVDAVAAVTGLMPLIRRSMPESIEIVCRNEAVSLVVRVDPNQLDSAVLNLVLNSRDAMPDGGCLSLTVQPRHLLPHDALALGCGAGDFVSICISDTGIGMEQATLNRALEPFFTTKEFGHSSGLGLSMVYGFAHQSKGAIRLNSVLGQGTTAELLIPLEQGAADSLDTDCVRSTRAVPPTQLVLLVEDEDEVRRVVRKQLQELGHHIIESATAAEAVEILKRTHGITVLLSDVVIPGGMSGVDLASNVRAHRPGIKIVLMTGYAGVALEGVDGAGEWRSLRKPFSNVELEQALAGEAEQ